MTVRLHVWRVRRAAVPLAFWGMAVDRRRLRRQAGFVKLLGTGRGSDFGAGRTDLTRWAAIIVGDAVVVPPMRGAIASCVVTLAPIASRGTWAGHAPFDSDGRSSPAARKSPADRTTDPADRRSEPADGRRDPTTQKSDPPDGRRDPADRNSDPAAHTRPADGNGDPADGTSDPADGTRPADGKASLRTA
ncbi:hypothetical protein [Dactylosporangium cerinum]